MKANSVQNIGLPVNMNSSTPNFRSDRVMLSKNSGQDEFVQKKKSNSAQKLMLVIGGIGIAATGLILAHKADWFKKTEKLKDILDIKEFKKISEAKEYFEKLGIETDFRGAKDEHLSMLNRIKDNLKELKELGVKKDKPDSITISDWKNKNETAELFAKRGSTRETPPESGYYKAFCVYEKGKKAHIMIDSNASEFNNFKHEMGHANHHIGLDNYWNSKGLNGYDYADKQLEILGLNEKIYRNSRGQRNIIEFPTQNTSSKYAFANENGEVRYAYIQSLIDRMQQETHAYDGGKDLAEQIAYVFENLCEKKTFSDEIMLYYDFAGGARIPNLKINGKTYDSYIESLYNNSELVQKLKNNINIMKV